MGTRAGAVGISFLLKKVKEQLIYQLIHQLIEQYKMYQLEGEENMITKTQFKDAVKKTIICTIMNQPEIIYNLDQDEDGAMKILVGFYKRLIKKLYRKRGELKDCNEINEIYVIAFECLYKEDGETPAYVIYEENMLCLSSINALTQMCQEVIDNYYCELTSEIQKELEEE